MKLVLLFVRNVMVVVSLFGLVNWLIGMWIRCWVVCFGFFVNSFVSSGVLIGFGYSVLIWMFCCVYCIFSFWVMVSILFFEVVYEICEVVDFSIVMNEVVLMIEFFLVGIMC